MSDVQDPSETPVTTVLAAVPTVEPASVGAAQPADPTAPAPAPSFESVWDDAMPRWLASQVANSPIARNTEAFNHLVETALPALRQAILEMI